MTERQSNLLVYLEAHKNEDRFISKFEISNACGYGWDFESDRNGRNIESDVRALNNEDLNLIIVSNQDGYKIGNETETNIYLKKLFDRTKNQLRKYWSLKRKAETNGQYQLDITEEEAKYTEALRVIFND